MRELDPVALEIANHRLAAIAEEMGVVLGRTALSPNVKERRDYSCAVFDARGALVAQAAHIPVHLGATPLSVRAAIARVPRKQKGRCNRTGPSLTQTIMGITWRCRRWRPEDPRSPHASYA